ncbi:MAG TPA: PIN domain-containing protein [Candidatus Thermoplasmatota archaeon]|nr:PIN domain-containing protein [Candidatus Thermoplasmatota archaeon]
MPILDTTFLIDVLRGHERAVDLLARLEPKRDPLSISAVTLAEFHRGFGTVNVPDAVRARVVETVEGRIVHALDEQAARIAGEIEARAWRKGEPLDPEDAMIAATALSRGEALVTRRTTVFGRIEGLRLQTY